MTEALVCVGALAGAYGVKGEVRIKSFCTEPEAIAGFGPLLSEDGTRSFRISGLRRLGGGLAARIDGVSDRDAAEALRGTRLHVTRDRLPALSDDEYYHADLIGLRVQDAAGQLLGRVHAVHDHGAGDLLEVRAPDRRESVLVPFTRQIVPTVDLAAGLMVADPPEGLFD